MESMECSAVEWSGMESMECSAVEWNGMESMECSAVEWNVREKMDLLFFGQSDNFHFSKVAHFFWVLRGAFENGLKQKACHKISCFENDLFTWVFKCFFVRLHCVF